MAERVRRLRHVLAHVRRRGPVALARRFLGLAALYGWQEALSRTRSFAGGPRPPGASAVPATGHAQARAAQLDFCQRYAKEPPLWRQRMIAQLLEAEPASRGVVLCPVVQPQPRSRSEHVLRAFARAGWLVLVLPIDSAIPSVEHLDERLVLARLFPDAFAYFRDLPVVLYLDSPRFAYATTLLAQAFVVYDVQARLPDGGADAAALREDHEALRTRADLVMAASSSLVPAGRGDATLVVPNGADLAELAHLPPPPLSSPRVVGYHGPIDERLDFALLERVAAIPGVALHLAGAVQPRDAAAAEGLAQRVAALRALANVRVAGPGRLAFLRGWFAPLHAVVLARAPDPGADDVAPPEAWEGVASGRPVFALPHSAWAPFGDAITVGTAESLVAALAAAADDPGRAQLASRVADAHDWSALVAPALAKLAAWSERHRLPDIDLPTSRRVDILNFNFFDWNGERVYNGGAERYVLDLALLCRRLGLTPRLLQNANRPFEREHHGVPVVGLPLVPHFDLERMSRAYGAHVADAALVVASPVELAARLQGRRRVVGINHGIHWDAATNTLANYGFQRDRLLFDALQAVDACVCVDTNFINWVRCHDWQLAQALDYVPNYVDLDVFRPRPKDFRADRLTVLYPRRLYRARGFQDTLEACGRLLDRGLPIDLVLCGGADEAEDALAQAFVARHAGRAQRIELDIREMHRVYETSHIALIPTNFAEGTSLSCIEAMATNNAVIATTVGGLPNLILDGYNGLLVKPGAPGLGHAIERLVDDRALLAALAGNALRVAPTLSHERWARQWTELLQRLLPTLVPAEAAREHA